MDKVSCIDLHRLTSCLSSKNASAASPILLHGRRLYCKSHLKNLLQSCKQMVRVAMHSKQRLCHRACMAAATLQQWCRSQLQGHLAGKRTIVCNIELSCNDIGILVLGIGPRKLAGVTVPECPAFRLAGNKFVQVKSCEFLQRCDDLSKKSCISYFLRGATGFQVPFYSRISQNISYTRVMIRLWPSGLKFSSPSTPPLVPPS